MARVFACLGALQFVTPGMCLVQTRPHRVHSNSINMIQLLVHQMEMPEGRGADGKGSGTDWEFQNLPKTLPPDDEEEVEEGEDGEIDMKKAGKDTEEEDDEEDGDQEESEMKNVNEGLVQVKREVAENKFTKPAEILDDPVVKMRTEGMTNTTNMPLDVKPPSITIHETPASTTLLEMPATTPIPEMPASNTLPAVSNPATNTPSTYVLEWYADNNCHRPHVVRSSTLLTTDKPGCYKIMEGKLSGNFFLLDCPDGNAEQVSQRIYKKENCEGDPLTKRYLAWRMFKGKCQHHQKIQPPLRPEDYPPCKQAASVVEEAVQDRELGDCDCSWARRKQTSCVEATNDGSHCFVVCCAGALKGHLPQISSTS